MRKTSGQPDEDVRRRFDAALAAFLHRARQDPYILAVILCGSFSHDVVWEKSDLDLVLVVKEDTVGPYRSLADRGFSLTEEGLNIHLGLIGRSEFRKMLDGSVRSTFTHSFLAKGRIVYTRDETLRELYEANLNRLGARDRETQLLAAATQALYPLSKAEKWYHAKGDLDYAALWLLYCANELARVEICLAGEVAGREVLQPALRLNPAFFKAVYTDLLNAKKTPKLIESALGKVNEYLEKRIGALFGPILEYLRAEASVRSATEIDSHFQNHLGVPGATMACEWLADKDVIAKVSSPVRLTPKSRTEFQELAFYYDGEDRDG